MVLCLRRVEDAGALVEMVDDSDAFYDFLNEPETAADLIDFDKAWQVIHFLLTGTAFQGEAPLSFLLHAGSDIGADNGYGPARLASPAEVRAFRDALVELDDSELHRRYDPTAMAAEDVYLAATLAQEGDEGWSYVIQSLPALRTLLDRSVETNSSVAIWIA
ncbi:MAG TPA: YfbM family protein [Novosphingobium sp.]